MLVDSKRDAEGARPVVLEEDLLRIIGIDCELDVDQAGTRRKNDVGQKLSIR